jgi:monofunctional biosynthetic peptidoglycan transglycosylase
LRRALLYGVLALLAVWSVVWALQVWYLGWVLWYRWQDPRQTAFMRARLGELREERADARLDYRRVPYARIARSLKRAIVVAEDAHFVEHEGFDWEGIQRAMQKNRRKGRVVAGGSTISQQLSKNLFLSTRRSYLRKAQEAAITVMVETLLSKERILELYLNVIEWGDGVFGAEAAAHRYFGVPASALSASQAALLAAMVPNPRYYERNLGNGRLRRRASVILRGMGEAELPEAQKPRKAERAAR